MTVLKNKTVLWIASCLMITASAFASETTNTTFEGEEAETLFGVEVKSSNKGFEGNGYVDYGAAGSYVEWSNVFASEGEAVLAFRYSNASPFKNTRPTGLYVNGAVVTTISWPDTGTWTNWGTEKVNVKLQSGKNTIKLMQISALGPNLDQLTVTAKPVVTGTVPGLIGLYEVDAVTLIKSAGMTVGTVTSEHSTTVESGRVIRQTPEALSTKPRGYPVDLVISQGPPMVGKNQTQKPENYDLIAQTGTGMRF